MFDCHNFFALCPVTFRIYNDQLCLFCVLTVQIYAAKQAYPTNTDVTLLAVAEVPDPVEFLWHFGDSSSAKTTSRTITKRYYKPGRYETQMKFLKIHCGACFFGHIIVHYFIVLLVKFCRLSR